MDAAAETWRYRSNIVDGFIGQRVAATEVAFQTPRLLLNSANARCRVAKNDETGKSLLSMGSDCHKL